MTNAAYFTILTYSVLAVFCISAIIYRYRKDLKYWWLRNFTETITIDFYTQSALNKGEVYVFGPNFKRAIYLGKNKFKHIK